ncbi:hypothetical protein D9623_13775 [Azospirillum brasilense]|uniref:Uncharacterized protein n=2 Tax=Azospirillum brasilense TaxID=192 RepID=A0A4D8QR67_AZOBR|nr:MULTISPECIES: hypothetical protein [Azospirillum]MDW7557523.1 hypothetical protein [Azospirillum brasilense]MDW7597201.1 hypothetical protein [Azospirillum brasilense]MDW7632376.1 hypothetical protein [Azospirillum brasilense]MDX5953012.1 hypothetical protein [Azospirillum brasilense]OPH14305.1 hypothetical protein FE89_17165 [Azospirillum brasilense]
MIRFAPAFCLTVTLALGSGGAALGQTVADYEAALAKAPLNTAAAGAAAASPATASGTMSADVPSATDVLYCRPVSNYVYTSVPPGERSGIVVPFVAFDGPSDPETLRKRDLCETVRRMAVIQFDSGSGEEIVTPPQLIDTDPSRPLYQNDPTLAPDTRRAPARRPLEIQ